MSIYTKLHAIMQDVDYIQKDKSNPHFGYRYASEAAIKTAIHEAMVKHGVVMVPSCKITNRMEYEAGSQGKSRRSALTDVELTVRFVDVESGEHIETLCVGTGDDGADKGTYKAITGALKYLLTSTFLIPTGDDPEDEPEPKPRRSEQQPEGKGPSREVQKQARANREAEKAEQKAADPIVPEIPRTQAIAPAGTKLSEATGSIISRLLNLTLADGSPIVPDHVRLPLKRRLAAGALTEAEGQRAAKGLETGIDTGAWPEPKGAPAEATQ